MEVQRQMAVRRSFQKCYQRKRSLRGLIKQCYNGTKRWVLDWRTTRRFKSSNIRIDRASNSAERHTWAMPIQTMRTATRMTKAPTRGLRRTTSGIPSIKTAKASRELFEDSQDKRTVSMSEARASSLELGTSSRERVLMNHEEVVMLEEVAVRREVDEEAIQSEESRITIWSTIDPMKKPPLRERSIQAMYLAQQEKQQRGNSNNIRRNDHPGHQPKT